MATSSPKKEGRASSKLEKAMTYIVEESESKESNENMQDSSDDDSSINDVAFKSVEIDHDILQRELLSLRKTAWEIQEQIYSKYDFGLIQLDCRKYRKRLLAHCQSLISQVEEHVKGEFLHKLNLVQLEKEQLQRKVDAPAENIDDVIMLLDFIDNLKEDQSRIDEIGGQINGMKNKMDDVEDLEICFEDSAYMEYLHARNWPRTFRVYINHKKAELMSKKENLFKEMNNDINDIFLQIARFKRTVDDLMLEGLCRPDVKKEQAMFNGVKAKNEESGSETYDSEMMNDSES